MAAVPSVMAGHPPVSMDRFLSLFTVQFLHAFYNADDDRCEDFSVLPTPACAAWMKRMGMMFRDRGNGFSIDVPGSRMAALLGATGPTGAPAGLSFMLLLRNPGFVGITDWPISTVPTQQNLYASNLKTNAGRHALNLGSQAEGVGAQDLYPITGATLRVLGRRKGTLTVTDMTGAPIAPQAIFALQAGQPCTVDLSACPHGLYALEAKPRTAYAGPPFVLFMPDRPLTSGLITLFLRQPEGQGDARAFPLRGQGMKTVNLCLPFAARQTYWHYYVVSQGGQSAFLDDLAIAGDGTTFARSAARLPSGEQAVLFTAATPLPLRQRSPYRFSLTGHRRGGDGGRGNVQVTPLPTAPASPVWPSADDDAMSGTSEIYVYV